MGDDIPTNPSVAEIDAAFGRMAADGDYHAEAERLCQELACADWEAFLFAESWDDVIELTPAPDS